MASKGVLKLFPFQELKLEYFVNDLKIILWKLFFAGCEKKLSGYVIYLVKS